MRWFNTLALTMVVVVSATQVARAQFTTLVSTSLNGGPGNQTSWTPSITRDGRFVAFASDANNLVDSDTNGQADIFIYDQHDGLLERVSVTGFGIQSNGLCVGTALSDDGRYVAFYALANNLVPGAIGGTFVKDRVTGAIACMSVRDTGVPVAPQDGFFGRVSISANGRHVAFDAQSSLVTNDSADIRDVYVHDRDSDGDGVFDDPGGIRTLRVSISSSGIPGDDESRFPDMSPDGRFIAFDSAATNLVTNDTNSDIDAFIHDRDADGNGVFDEPGGVLTERVSVATGGKQTDSNVNNALWPSVSGDGRFVAFHSRAADVVADDTNGLMDVFVRDRFLDQTVRISLSADGEEGNGNSGGVSEMTDDARFISFYSWASNLVPLDSNGGADDLVIFDRLNRSIKLINYTNEGVQIGTASGASLNLIAPVIDQTGRLVAFSTLADLVNPASPFRQVYLRDRGPGFLADVDGTGSVDVDDLIAIILNWGACSAPPAACAADLDGSGVVDVDDLISVILNWG